MIDILNNLIFLLMIPMNIILSNFMILMGYITADSIIILRAPVGFVSSILVVSFSDFLIAKSIIKDIKNYKKKIIVKEKCVGEACNIPALTTAS